MINCSFLDVLCHSPEFRVLGAMEVANSTFAHSERGRLGY